MASNRGVLGFDKHQPGDTGGGGGACGQWAVHNRDAPYTDLSLSPCEVDGGCVAPPRTPLPPSATEPRGRTCNITTRQAETMHQQSVALPHDTGSNSREHAATEVHGHLGCWGSELRAYTWHGQTGVQIGRRWRCTYISHRWQLVWRCSVHAGGQAHAAAPSSYSPTATAQ